MYYTLDKMVQDVQQSAVLHPPNGAVLFYDSLYASYNSDPRRKVTPETIAAGGWIEVPLPADYTLPGQTWKLYLSPHPLGRADHATTGPVTSPTGG